MTLSIANILTSLRLLLTPVFIALFVSGYREEALVVFCIAGFTDLIDGTAARIFGQPSKGGALLDPIADKFLVQSSFALLFSVGIIPWWFFTLALSRDVIIVAGIIYLEKKKRPLPYRPLWISKFATLFQLGVAVLGLFIWWKFGGETVRAWHWNLVLFTAMLIILSGVQYIRMGIRILGGERMGS